MAAVVAGGRGVVREGVADESAGVLAVDSVVLGTDAVVAERAASGVEGEVAVDAVERA